MPKARAKHVVVVLVDGLSAERFAAWRGKMRAMDALAAEGLIVHRLTPPTPSTSLPGRATLLTGCGTDVHGIYGNNMLDGVAFRPARAADIRVSTFAASATRAGRRVIGLGFGMLDPADTAAHLAPWWQHLPQPGETNLKYPGLPPLHDPAGLLAGLADVPPLSCSPMRTMQGRLADDVRGLIADTRMLEAAGDLLCGDDPPELILTEIAVVDPVMHHHGTATGAALWIALMADLLIGRLVERLRACGRWDDTVLAVVSDHGHGPIERALYPAAILPGDVWASEGASLHVHVRSSAQHRRVTDNLAHFGAIALPGDHLPIGLRDGIAGFAAPLGSGFEKAPDDVPPAVPSGPPIVVSTHGNRPGSPCDDAICILAGGRLGAAELPLADMTGFAPSLAALMGFELDPAAAAPFPTIWRK